MGLLLILYGKAFRINGKPFRANGEPFRVHGKAFHAVFSSMLMSLWRIKGSFCWYNQEVLCLAVDL